MDPERPLTPSQTIGPFFHEGLEWLVRDRPTDAKRDEHEWLVEGIVTDGNGAGVPDALLEVWQPGRPPSPAECIPDDLQRVYTSSDGRYTFTIRRPANEPAVALWRSLGFRVIGTVPEAFAHPEHGLVGLHVMYLRL